MNPPSRPRGAEARTNDGGAPAAGPIQPTPELGDAFQPNLFLRLEKFANVFQPQVTHIERKYSSYVFSFSVFNFNWNFRSPPT